MKYARLYPILKFRKFVHTNLPQAGFELKSLGLQAGMLPIVPPLLVTKSKGRFAWAIQLQKVIDLDEVGKFLLVGVNVNKQGVRTCSVK